MNLNEILKEIKELNISKDNFYIEEDAALVIREIIDSADIIKICMSSDMIKYLVNTHKVIAKGTKHFTYNKVEIREGKISSFDIEECEPYNLESISKRMYILMESNKDIGLIKKIKEYVGPSFLYIMNEEEYEVEKKKGAKLEETDGRGETPIFRAVRNNNIELTIRMIEDGANVNALNSKGCNLGFFCSSLNMMKLLIEKGLNFKTKNNKGNTAIEYIEDNKIKEYLQNL